MKGRVEDLARERLKFDTESLANRFDRSHALNEPRALLFGMSVGIKAQLMYHLLCFGESGMRYIRMRERTDKSFRTSRSEDGKRLADPYIPDSHAHFLACTRAHTVLEADSVILVLR